MRYGIRWIFLGHDETTVNTYPESQMGDLNAIFADNNIEFFIHERQRIINPIATEGSSGSTIFPLTELIPDLRQFLNSEEEDPQTLVNLFKSGLEAQGADLDERSGSDPAFELNSGWKARSLHGAVARLHPEVITVMVRQAQGEKSTGTYPGVSITRPFSGMIYLAQTTELSALPHEMGHFFGLPHTHGTWNRAPGATQAWKLSTINRATDDDWAALQSVAGAGYSNRFTQAYPSFNDSIEAVATFAQGQIMARKVLGWTDLTYRGDFEPIADDATFISMIRARNAPMMKNFVRESEGGDFAGNNCSKSYTGDDRRTLRCKYGDDANHQRRSAEDPLVGGSLLFAEDSSESNLMSYIGTDTSDGQRRKRHLTQRQRDLIRLGSHMPSRLRLRNHAAEGTP
jgi:hypothetical protein